MQHIRAVCFDLDDTLWDLGPVIPRAELLLHEWLAQEFPRVVELYSQEQLHRLRMQYGARYPELRHDLTALRMKMLRQIFRDAGYSEEHADEAFAVFDRGRNAVTLYDDVLPALQALSGSHQLFAFTNGNARLDVIGIDHLFAGIVTARELGVAKPAKDFFAAALQRCALQPEEALHVGDHPENDIQAAAEVGMATVWVNRNSRAWSLDECAPDHELPDLQALPELLRR